MGLFLIDIIGLGKLGAAERLQIREHEGMWVVTPLEDGERVLYRAARRATALQWKRQRRVRAMKNAYGPWLL